MIPKKSFRPSISIVEWCILYSIPASYIYIYIYIARHYMERWGEFSFNDRMACSVAVNQIWQDPRRYLTAVQPKPNEKHWSGICVGVCVCVCLCKNVFIFISYYPSKTARVGARGGGTVNNVEKQIRGWYTRCYLPIYMISTAFGWLLYICERLADSCSKTILVDRARAL